MPYSEDELEQMREKLKQLKDLLSLQIDMGEDTNVVSDKIRELEQILREN